MNANRQRVSTKLDHFKEIENKQVTVKDETGRKIEGELHIEEGPDREGKIIVSAHYPCGEPPTRIVCEPRPCQGCSFALVNS